MNRFATALCGTCLTGGLGLLLWVGGSAAALGILLMIAGTLGYAALLSRGPARQELDGRSS